MPGVLAIVLAGGEGKRLMPLTLDRAKPAVPFGGQYRLVDFALSNLANAGFLKIVVLTQYKSHSLDLHISRTWRMSTLLGNYVTTVPAQMRRGRQWFAGSADAVFQNLNIIGDEQPDYICVFGADHIYRMDPRQMLDQHLESGAASRSPQSASPSPEASQFGVIEPGRGRRPCIPGEATRPDGRCRDDPDHVLASMGNYVFSTGPCSTPRRGRRGRQTRATTWAATSSRRLVAERRGRLLRLLATTDVPGCDRPRPRVLARRRHARQLLRRQHGPRLRAPHLQPVQP